jgi:hypothetical protein
MFIVVACSPKVLNTDDGTQMVLEIVRRYPKDSMFATNYTRIKELVEGDGFKCMLFFTIATFRNRTDGLMDMARRMMEPATHFHTIVEEGGTVKTACIMAIEFQRQHPGYYMEIQFKTPTGVRNMQIDEMKRMARWML